MEYEKSCFTNLAAVIRRLITVCMKQKIIPTLSPFSVITLLISLQFSIH